MTDLGVCSMLTRRAFFSFSTGLIAAPAIIKLAPIMAIKPLRNYGQSPPTLGYWLDQMARYQQAMYVDGHATMQAIVSKMKLVEIDLLPPHA